MSEVTLILERAQGGDKKAAEELLPLVYDELRKLAAAKMAQESEFHTLQPTALVHEAWLRLVKAQQDNWQGRGYFFAAAAEAMRRILIEAARRRARQKRGGNLQRVSLDQLDLAATTDDETLIATSEALDRFAAVDPVGAELIKLRFFVGLSNADAAKALGLAERTAKRTWAYARAWLHAELTRRDAS
jgi:RNA polymerase sigma factor (TIGR02999 family)